MDMALKRDLISQLETVAPDFGLIELTYPSFMRCFGYRSQPLSACDAVEGISALLDVAGGVKMEVEVEGARNGGEWFGMGKLWEIPGLATGTKWRKDEDTENIPPGGHPTVTKSKKSKTIEEDGEVEESKEVEWWVRNFWMAYDALSE
jgi:cell division control protein 45